MSQQGLNVATSFGQGLPSFPSKAAAEVGLFRLRDAVLRDLGQMVVLDYSPESLKVFEAWFFAQPEPRRLPNGDPLELSVGFYIGEVVVRHANFHWVVQPFVFASGKYEIGVNRGGATITVTKGWSLSLDRNKRMQSLWREYQKFAG